MREAVAHQLLVPDGPDGYAFRHALLREAVYNDLLPGERTRLHARLAALLSGVPGAAAELAHHSLASHDVPGAFTASIRAGEEAHRIGAPAEAHQHYDQALALWDRVPDAELLAGMSRGKLGLRSALAAAASGDVPRAVHLLRRIRALARRRPTAGCRRDDDPSCAAGSGSGSPTTCCRARTGSGSPRRSTVARDTVHETPHDPPTWYLARAMATYAIALMVAHDDDEALGLGAAGPRGRAGSRARGPSRRTRWSRSAS